MTNPQRKGQWLYNEIRKEDEETKQLSEMKIKTQDDLELYRMIFQTRISQVLWNMSNKQFDKLMRGYENG